MDAPSFNVFWFLLWTGMTVVNVVVAAANYRLTRRGFLVEEDVDALWHAVDDLYAETASREDAEEAVRGGGLVLQVRDLYELLDEWSREQAGTEED